MFSLEAVMNYDQERLQLEAEVERLDGQGFTAVLAVLITGASQSRQHGNRDLRDTPGPVRGFRMLVGDQIVMRTENFPLVVRRFTR
ncbi:hypothetical protein Tco_0703439 [Tanacetum coccineum]|uniref:Uncharacterized protein n=1 Tax=Tanacetum coccineum TaxID=301880 RepID=A0ABQ4Y0D1_9ASTR